MTDTLVVGRGTRRDPMHAPAEDDYLPPTTGILVYRLQHGEDEHVGVVADVSVLAFADGRVRGHEAVCPARVKGLVEHFASVPRRTELVTLLHAAGPDVDRTVEETLDGSPLVDFIGPDGWRQTVWRVSDAASVLLADALDRSVHYIADGHHRVAASLALWERAGRPTEAALLCVLYPQHGLRLRAFRRRVRGPVDPDQLRLLLAGCCDVSECALGETPTGGTSVYVDGTWLRVEPAVDRPAGVGGLDLTILEQHVLTPLLGAAMVERTESISVTSPLGQLVSLCDRDGGALFVLAPPTLEQLREVADLGQVMPPKTTYFDPKPYAGIIVR
ncbi:DUF1015 family protein [Nocardioides sp. Root140]|uniref:DUF1015 family protein n=2 Tax=unclassified Nocardioides TaxID=2615069 RepID=UPI00138F28D0|nr:DUF1015 family protein [Nocardioides sp. Root140]